MLKGIIVVMEKKVNTSSKRKAANYLVHVSDLPARSKGFSLGNKRVMKEFVQTSDSPS